MDKTIVTALLVMAGVISAVVLFNTLYPMVQQSGDAMTSMQRRLNDQIQTQVKIVNAAKYDNNTVLVWAKNVGSARIIGTETSDVFMGPVANFARIPYGGGSAPNWTYAIENASDWSPTATVRITVTVSSPLPASPSGTYFAKIVLPNGISDETFFSW